MTTAEDGTSGPGALSRVVASSWRYVLDSSRRRWQADASPLLGTGEALGKLLRRSKACSPLCCAVVTFLQSCELKFCKTYLEQIVK